MTGSKGVEYDSYCALLCEQNDCMYPNCTKVKVYVVDSSSPFPFWLFFHLYTVYMGLMVA